MLAVNGHVVAVRVGGRVGARSVDGWDCLRFGDARVHDHLRDEFDVVLVNAANLALLKNNQSFQYYAAYSGRALSSATLPEQSFIQPEPL